MFRESNARPRRQVAAATLLVISFLSGWTLADDPIVRIEEDWELLVKLPDNDVTAPQIITAFTPLENLAGIHATFEINHISSVAFASGGLHLSTWCGETHLAVVHAGNFASMFTDGEIVRWTQSIEVADGELTFEIKDGSSTTWGAFGGNGSLRLQLSSTLENLDSYRPTASISNSEVSYAGNRVQNLSMKRVRYIRASGHVESENCAAVRASVGIMIRHGDGFHSRKQPGLRIIAMKRKSKLRARRGNVIVLSAFLMIGMMGMIAFAVDLGYLYNVRTEMQRAADASAIAACWELIDDDAVLGTPNVELLASNCARQGPTIRGLQPHYPVDRTTRDRRRGGGIHRQSHESHQPLHHARIHRLAERRAGEDPSHVAAERTDSLVFRTGAGSEPGSAETEATAAYLPGVSGFKSPSDGSNLGILPYALDQDTWNNMLAGGGSDSYRFTEGSGSGTVTEGPDGIREVNLFPQGTGSPGNRGTVDIGGANNSTSDIARQIVYGISSADMAQMPESKLEFDSSGKLYLNGDTGISAGVKDEMASIIGQTRMIPIFSHVSGNGNNATYTIVKFVGIRMMYVKLTGSNKEVMVQPAVVLSKGAIPSSTSRSDYIYSPVWLVR